MNAIKLVITNSVNDEERIKWFFYNTEEERVSIETEMKKEQDEWNSGGVAMGYMSKRYYSFKNYTLSDLLTMNISELEGMTVKDFLIVIMSANELIQFIKGDN